jgi:uncharacterized alpha-E superfamily protein
MARATLERLMKGDMKDVFGMGLHEFLTEFIENNDALGAAIGEQYLIHVDEAMPSGEMQSQA